jgi:hypothetical protein
MFLAQPSLARRKTFYHHIRALKDTAKIKVSLRDKS